MFYNGHMITHYSLFYSSGSRDVCALNPGGDQRLLPYKCNQWCSPDVSDLLFVKKQKQKQVP